MAQKNPTTPGRSRTDSIRDLVDDLELLRVSPTRYDGTDVNSMVQAREERINELQRVNGTLNEVCFQKCVSTNCQLKAFQTSKIHKLLGSLLGCFVKSL